MNGPHGIAVDTGGNLFIADTAPVESAIRVPLGATTVPFTVTNAPVVDPKSPAIKATVNGRTKSTVISVKPGS